MRNSEARITTGKEEGGLCRWFEKCSCFCLFKYDYGVVFACVVCVHGMCVSACVCSLCVVRTCVYERVSRFITAALSDVVCELISVQWHTRHGHEGSQLQQHLGLANGPRTRSRSQGLLLSFCY